MSYTEVVRSVRAAQGGAFTSKNQNVVTATFLKALVNCTLENDHWETEPGARKLNAVSAGEDIIFTTLHYWEPIPGMRRLIACTQHDAIYKSSDDGATWKLIAEGGPV